MQELIFPQLQYNLCPSIMILMYVHSIDLPTLYELIDFTLCDGTRLNVAERIGTDSITFGILLLNDATGATIRAIEKTHRGRPIDINREILQEWMGGRGRPVTWNVLVEVLRAIHLNILADSISAVKLDTCN